jgi:peptidoglycan/xylan/chitin deacetylase (PgdA/CDA1 family)
MFLEHEILGNLLPPGTLCLTYDDGPGRTEHPDGPGPRTAELAAFLHSQGVAATFFVVGKFAAASVDILKGLRSLGHLVANHTFDHPSLPAFVARGGDVVDQLERTDRVIRGHIAQQPALFRPPYGDWRLRDQGRSNVAAVLNRSGLATSHVGPIGWDIDAGDVGFWRDGRSAHECARAYLESIERAGRGIVLMHDNTADIEELRPRNRALGLTRILVPELRRLGYRFVRLDAVPQVASAARVSFQLILTAHDGRPVPAVLTPPDMATNAPYPADSSAIWGVVDLGRNRWALRAIDGLFLSPRGREETVAGTPVIRNSEIFTVEDLGERRIELRTIHGTYLSRPPCESGVLLAQAPRRGECEVFSMHDSLET